MKKLLWTVLCAVGLSACLCAGEKLWDGSLDSVKLDWGKQLPDVSVKAENGVLDISATSRGKSVTYISVEIAVKPFKLGGKSISFDAWSSEGQTTDTFYFRAQDAKKRNLLSFQQWGAPLKSSPDTRIFSPGISVPKMKWEPEMIKAKPDADICRLVFYIGSRGDGRKMNLKIRNIELVEAVLPKPEKKSDLLKDDAYLKRIRKDHPRLFFTKEMIPAIRACAQARPKDLQKLKEMVDKLPDDPQYVELTDKFTRNEKGEVKPKKAGGVQGYLLLKHAGGIESARCALLWMLTQDEKYRVKAIKYLRLYRKALEFSDKGNWWMDLLGNTRINAMLAYDILYDTLTPEERRELILPIFNYIRDTQPEGRLKFRRTIGGARDGNYGERALQYFIGVTLYGDGIADKEAEEMLKRGAALFVEMLDFRDKAAAGSGLLSSLTTGYSFGAYPLATHLFFYSWKSAFGEDISDRWNQMLYYHRFVDGMTFLPDGKGQARLFGIGDMWHTTNMTPVGGAMYTHFANNIHFYAAKHPEQAAEMYAFLAALPENQRILGWWTYPMFPFLTSGFDPAKVKPGKIRELPYYYTPRFGLLTMRSGRGPADTYASFRFGGDQGNHQHYDDLSFVIFKHDFLALDSGSRTEMDHHHNYTSQTVAHNSILIHMDKEPMAPFWKAWSYKDDGKTYYCHGGQNQKEFGRAVALQSGPDFIYAAGDATGNYASEKCAEAVRQFVWLKPNVFVIYDRVTSVKPDQKKEVLIHTQNKPEAVAPGVYRADLNKGRLFVQTLLPVDAPVTLVGGPGKEFFASGHNWPLEPDVRFQYAGNWRIETAQAKPEKAARFLQVLQAADTSVAKPFPAKVRAEGEYDVVTVNGYELKFRRTGEVGLILNGKVLPNRVEKLP